MKQKLLAWVARWLRDIAPLQEIRAEHRTLKWQVALLAAEVAKLKPSATSTPPTHLDQMPIDPHLGRM